MKLTHTQFDPSQLLAQESVFFTANGYLGVRGNFEEHYAPSLESIRGCYINGFYDDVPIRYSERLYGFPETAQRMVNLPDVQTMRLFVDGQEFSLFTGTVHSYLRQMDTDSGTHTRKVEWESDDGKRVRITITRMASFVRKELFLTEYTVENLGERADVVLHCGVDCRVTNYVNPDDPRVAAEEIQHIVFDEAQTLADGGSVLCHTAESKLQIAVCQRLDARIGGEKQAPTVKVGDRTLDMTLAAVLEEQQTLCVTKYTTLSDARKTKEPLAYAGQVAAACMEAGARALLDEQAAYLADIWRRSRVQIFGDDAAQEGIEYCLYGLLQSAGSDAISNVSAKGLSGEGYEGHYFWDTEIYIFPFFLMTQPRLAQKLLEYRYNILDNARAQARLLGHTRGALYPWRTISGTECSSYFPSGSAQYHITGDVAHSFLDYYDVTGDVDFMASKGAEVLLETARLWLCAGHYDREGRFCIDDVTGPDEYTCIVNNNYYTNAAAKNNLLGALRVFRDLREANLHEEVAVRIGLQKEELEAFAAAANAMYLPHDEALGISAQDDSFLNKAVWDFEGTPKENYPLLLYYHPLQLYRHQVCKQADTVLAHFLFGADVPNEVIKRSYDYYEKITTHDSSLSTCVFSIMAAQLGNMPKAMDYYMHTLRTDLDNSHANTKDGIHTANMGGAYLGLVSGIAGLRIRKEGPSFTPRLPKAWTGYRFRLCWKSSLIEVDVCAGQAVFRLLEGVPIDMVVSGKRYRLEGEVRCVPIPE